MKIWIALLKGFGYLWMTAVVIFIVIGIGGTWKEGGFSAVQALWSPFNVKYWFTVGVILAPGLGALMWAEKLATSNRQKIPSENRISGGGIGPKA